MLAAGHPRAQLLNSLITCLLYAAVVIAFARLGLTVLCVAVVVVNVVTYLGQYKLLVQRLVGIPFSDLWGEIKPAVGGLVGLLALGGLCSLGLAATDLPSILQIILVSAVSGSAYLATVRIGFPDAWADIRMIAARMTSRKKAA